MTEDDMRRLERDIAKIRSTGRWILIAAVVICVGVLGPYFWIFRGGLAVEHGAWSAFGDFVGGVLNPGIGVLALVALIRTLQLQGSQLETATRDLVATARETQRERYESTATRLLLMLDKTAEEMVSPEASEKGLAAFVFIFERHLRPAYRRVTVDKGMQSEEKVLVRTIEEFRKDMAGWADYFVETAGAIGEFLLSGPADLRRRYLKLFAVRMSGMQRALISYYFLGHRKPMVVGDVLREVLPDWDFPSVRIEEGGSKSHAAMLRELVAESEESKPEVKGS